MRKDIYFFLIVLFLGSAGVYYTNQNKEVHTASIALAKSRQQVIANQSEPKDGQVGLDNTRSNTTSFSSLKIGSIPTTSLSDLAKIDTPDTSLNSRHQGSSEEQSNSLIDKESPESLQDWDSLFTSWYLTLLRNKSSSANFLGVRSSEKCQIDVTTLKSGTSFIQLSANSTVVKTDSTMTIAGVDSSIDFDELKDIEQVFNRTLRLVGFCQ